MRWLDHLPFGGASGILALRRAARAVQNGDANVVACVAGDTNHVDSFRLNLANFSRFARDAVYPLGSGGPNANFALLTSHYMQATGAKPEDFGKLCVAQRDNALSFPHALFKKKLTLAEYLNARPIADPLKLFDCVMPCAGAEGFLVLREDHAKRLGLKYARLLGTIERHNAFPDDPIQTRGGWVMDRDDLYAQAGLGPEDIDLFEAYDDYPVINCLQLEGLGFCGGRSAGLHPQQHLHGRRLLPVQYVRRAIVGRSGRRRRRFPRSGPGASARSPGRRSARKSKMPGTVSSAASA